MTSCKIEGCSRPVAVVGEGVCSLHYQRRRRTGDYGGPALRQGAEAATTGRRVKAARKLLVELFGAYGRFWFARPGRGSYLVWDRYASSDEEGRQVGTPRLQALRANRWVVFERVDDGRIPVRVSKLGEKEIEAQ